ncbi:MAG: hypothetical protein DRP87_00595 [Spirochaetes bacterium]|nr:MAG: hypothetical protein DRP87_00595 [Spirochaetota bacterium]
MELPKLLVSDSSGKIFEIHELYMAGMSLDAPVLPKKEDLIEIPLNDGALFYLTLYYKKSNNSDRR